MGSSISAASATVGATPSDQLVREYFPLGNRSVRSAQSELDGLVFRLKQRSRTTLAVETPASKVRANAALTH
jgi:hypothetical protein